MKTLTLLGNLTTAWHEEWERRNWLEENPDTVRPSLTLWENRANIAMRDLIEWCGGSLPRNAADKDEVELLLDHVAAEA